jgi:hypothetical protein
MKRSRLIPRYICVLVSSILCLFGSAFAHAELYDDFSSGTLDANKWIERIGSDVSNDLLTEHYVTNGFYHTASYDFGDRGVTLEIKNRTFSVGDIISYDVSYLAGAGNRRSFIRLDEYTSVSSSTALFGYWNGLQEGGVGNDFGDYQVKLSFLEAGIYAQITLPSGEIKTTQALIPYPVSGIQQHTLEFGTRTGDDGYVTMNYDNVYVTQVPEPSTFTLAALGILAFLGACRGRGTSACRNGKCSMR